MTNIPSSAQRQHVQERAMGYCEYCFSPAQYGVQSFECEHIIPVSAGGQTTLENLAFACGGCNRFKATKTETIDPDSGQIVSLYNPRKQVWIHHFAWNEDFTEIIGLTAVGRATISALRLNRVGVVNLRRVLYQVGEHPPSLF